MLITDWLLENMNPDMTLNKMHLDVSVSPKNKHLITFNFNQIASSKGTFTYTYKIAWSSTKQPERKTAQDTARMHTALIRCGVVVNVDIHMSIITVRSIITQGDVTVYNITIPLTYTRTKTKLYQKIKYILAADLRRLPLPQK